MNQTVSPAKRLSPTLLTVVMVSLLVALVFIYWGFSQYMVGDTNSASLFMIVGMVILAASTYMLYQTRRRLIRLMSVETQPLSSTVQCGKCGFKNIREFKNGDFVLKETDELCPKDSQKMVVSAIYREVKEKEKAKEINY